ncbi:response regulator transcription factor [uncultured Alsobacter sp.]|uniref:response regulator transcription factor n=1 Tax=uncultured Alsobacter sp. TaxID=1748258 RepID=UPI0025D04BC9|nr:helix-turn-helix transcriptional regulator [uncultured Alsobacter sp.]
MRKRLSPRELQVLGHLQRGAPNKAIARELGIADATVKVHVKKLLRHFGVTRRTQLMLVDKQTDPRVTALLEALRRIAAACPYPALTASRALHDYGDAP